MKRLLIVALSLCMSSFAIASSDVWKSSHTITNETGANLCGQAKGLIHSVVVGTANSGTVTLFDSRANTAATAIMSVMISTAANTAGGYFFDVKTSSGLTYTTNGSQDVTFMYLCGY